MGVWEVARHLGYRRRRHNHTPCLRIIASFLIQQHQRHPLLSAIGNLNYPTRTWSDCDLLREEQVYLVGFNHIVSLDHLYFSLVLSWRWNEQTWTVLQSIIPDVDSASGPGRSLFFTSPTCCDDKAWDATWFSYSLRFCSDAHRSLEALKTRMTPSLHPLTISPLGRTDTAHTEIAGWTRTWIHPSPKRLPITY